jgi:uncharacterized protein (DUF433 family)
MKKAMGQYPSAPGVNQTMDFTIHVEPVPFRKDEYGVVRVGDTQVLLDAVIREFKNGSSPEEIARGYSTLDLADVYAVIAYYLRHQGEVDAYLQARREEAERLRQEIETKQSGRAELRARLQARKAEREQGHASLRN